MKFDVIMQGIDYEIVQQSALNDNIESIALDSRQVKEKGMFICLRGLQVDGHTFIENVAQKGASVVVIDREQEFYPPNLTVCKVLDARKSLSYIAANFYGRPADKLRLFGVTGTNGKTSVTYIMESVLRRIGDPGLIGTVGISIKGKKLNIPFATSTTPDPPELQQIFQHMLDNGGQDVVMEVSSHALALHKMEGLFFEAAMFTNLTQDHLDFHGTMENYLAAKAKLFGQCRYGVVNGDDKYSPQIMTIGNCEKWITYGIDSDCDIRALHIKHMPEGSSFDIEIEGVLENFYLPVKGKFNIYNALAAIGAALAVGISVEHIKSGLAAFEGVPGRIQSVPNDKGFHVLVDYAHSPDGLVNIINAVRAFTTGQVITLFGCGGDRDKEKRPIMGRIAGELSDHCILTSDNPRSEPPKAIIDRIEEGVKDTSCSYDTFVDRRDAIFKGVAMLKSGDALIIAGKGHEDYQIIGDQTLHFDDVEIAKEALAAC
ncbi:MAG: UDP-N-acetylmuramoyl-L-alanyl-D-glutamate--2,6-diaminopimelate ligase [Defluviitaleaceae bacterium]|nr:UDP-N-acetylmuramoyl-L-alanyl-D-glutamate--2,6-diaminopimelate ligase [Defluviitaleaceae bacterium]